MGKRGLKTAILSSIISVLVSTPVLANSLNKVDVEKGEEYDRKKAEIRYTKIGKDSIREVYINGFRVNDQNLASLVNDKKLSEKIGQAINTRRTTWGASMGLGLPAGALLIYLASTSRAALPVNNTPAPIGQMNRAQSVDVKTFLLGTLGAVVTLYAVVNSVSLLQDVSGLNSPQVLNDKEAEDIVAKYNDNLKNDILNKLSTNLNLNNNSLSAENNNIMILNVNKSF